MVRKKFVGLRRSLELPSGFLDRFGERKMMGSIFSELSLSVSKAEAFRLLGGESADNARGMDVRFTIIEQELNEERDGGVSECAGVSSSRTILTILETREVLKP